jgi:hypothetical protein
MARSLFVRHEQRCFQNSGRATPVDRLMSKPISAEVILRWASTDKLSLDEPMFLHWVDPDLTHKRIDFRVRSAQQPAPGRIRDGRGRAAY